MSGKGKYLMVIVCCIIICFSPMSVQATENFGGNMSIKGKSEQDSITETINSDDNSKTEDVSVDTQDNIQEENTDTNIADIMQEENIDADTEDTIQIESSNVNTVNNSDSNIVNNVKDLQTEDSDKTVDENNNTDENKDTDEEVLDGFVLIDGDSYFYENGNIVTGEKNIDGEWYYFDPASNGKMIVGWKEFQTKRVYYDLTGKMCHGEQYIDGKWYYFDEMSGNMTTGWFNLPGKKVYYDSNGAMQKGEKYIDGKWYYFNKTTGKMTTGWYNLPGKKVYYGSDGAMRKGEQYINGKWYYFNKTTGKMTTGWYNLPGKKVYYGSDGAMRKGEQHINGKWYYFNKTTGKMTTGWYNLPGKKVYYGSDGAMRYGAQWISGKWYYFNKVTGELLSTHKMGEKAQSYSSSTSWLILVDTANNKVGIYNGRKNDWSEKYYWSCTTGAKSTPTVKGTFTVKSKGISFGSGYTCWYYTQFYGNYLFHSILYYPGSKTNIQDGRLGINASHGCVRLSLSNAKWIYDNIPKGTKVVIY